MGFEKVKVHPGVKVQLEEYKKYRIIVPIIRLKLTRDEDAVLAYYFVKGFKQNYKFLTQVSKFKKFTKVIWEPPRPQVCSEN